MTKAAMLFPGQGSQYAGMGKDLAMAYPRARELYERADDTLGFSLSQLSWEGDADTLTLTKNAQPAILLHSAAAALVLQEEAGIQPAIAAGHSLGEYSALVAAGALDEMDALRIVRRRGELMYQAGLERPGTMAAIIGLERDEVEEACREAAGEEIVVVANVNSPGQIVVSGHVGAVERAMKTASAKGAKKTIPLNVSGAFHSPLVAPAQAELVAYIESFEIRAAEIGVVTNVDARIVRTREEIVDALSRQLTNPVRWSESMTVLLGAWDGAVLEVGPGKVLSGLLKRIDGARSAKPAGGAEDLAALIAERTA